MNAKIGSLIGAIGGLVFILVNAGELPGAIALTLRCIGIAGFAFVVWYTQIRTRGYQSAAEPPTSKAMRVYWICVIAEVLSIPVGAMVINNVIDQPDLTVCWVVLVVGVHFLPFAKAFNAPIFTPLGWTLVGTAVIGGALTLTVAAQAAAWAAVLAGVALLVSSALGGRILRPAPAPAP
ncbi:hypothetical protein [Glycomyces buryatensis]|uniref:Uncharacterized protein n=1 Tax=Glycomyces buryatensis TaxID=2570927 RepID=A0A4S8QEE1_9ACTN|nr:hypothetical protein [Glycomyces buryatensis]THV41275.1 hypothetical protein FAB82_12710 [Glycomyces buryatensis]